MPALMPCFFLARGVASCIILPVTLLTSVKGIPYNFEMSLIRDFNCSVFQFEIGATTLSPQRSIRMSLIPIASETSKSMSG